MEKAAVKMKEWLMDASKRRSLTKAATVAAGALSVLSLGVAVMSGWVVVKAWRCIGSVQRTMPILRRAAQLYLDEHQK